MAAVCAYCGVASPATRDHVPPRNLFPPPRDSDLITVPCCEACRSGWSTDDEYLRNCIAVTWNVADDARAQKVIEAMFRSLTRPEARGLALRTLQDVEEVSVYSPGGIYLHQAARIPIDRARLKRVLGRIIRGLYFHETGDIMPEPFIVHASLQQEGLDYLAPQLSSVKFPLPTTVANGAFAYTFAAVPGSPQATLWLGLFFGKLPMIGLTRPPRTSAA